MKLGTLEINLNKCTTPKDFVLFAQKNGANVRFNKHYCIKHKTGEMSIISSTPKPKIPLHKTRNEFRRIYIKSN